MAGRLITWLICVLFTLSCTLCTNENHGKTKELYCWHGSELNIKMNQSCSSNKLHPPNMVSSTTVPENSTDSLHNGTTDENSTSTSNITRCYLYETDEALKFVPSKDGKIKDQPIVYRQGCDMEGYCKDQPVGENVRVTINNQTMRLFCCNTSNCNVHKPHTSNPPHHCYTLYEQGTTRAGCINMCKDDKAACVIYSYFMPNGQKEQSKYECDGEQDGIESLCGQFNKSIKGLQCVNKSSQLPNMTEEICCCFGNLCNKPTFHVTFRNDSRNCKYLPMKPVIGTTLAPKHVNPSSSKHVDWLFVGGIIGAVALVLLIVASVLIIVSRHRKNASQNNRLTLAYSRLAADRIPDDADDVQMLLS